MRPTGNMTELSRARLAREDMLDVLSGEDGGTSVDDLPVSEQDKVWERWHDVCDDLHTVEDAIYGKKVWIGDNLVRCWNAR